MTAAYGAASVFYRRVPFYSDSTKRLEGAGSRYDALDGMRGILAICVFVHHAAVSSAYFETGRWVRPSSYFLARLGSIPVLFFFLLSGFVFWNRVLSSREMNWAHFFADRARRIYPAYCLCFIGILATVLWSTGFEVSSPAAFTYGVARWMLVGLPDGALPDLNGFGATGVLNAHVFWTLRYELLFYFSLPALAWFRRGSRIFGLFIGLTVLYFALQHVFEPDRLGEWYAHTSLRFLAYLVSAFGGGMLTAWLRHRYPHFRVPAVPALFLSVAVLAVLMNLRFFPDTRLGFVVERAMILFVFAGVVFGNTFGGILTSRPTLFLGRVSYSIYVLHGLVLFATGKAIVGWVGPHRISELGQLAVGFVQAVLVVAAAAASYRFVEYPFLKRKPPETPNANQMKPEKAGKPAA